MLSVLERAVLARAAPAAPVAAVSEVPEERTGSRVFGLEAEHEHCDRWRLYSCSDGNVAVVEEEQRESLLGGISNSGTGVVDLRDGSTTCEPGPRKVNDLSWLPGLRPT